MTHSTSRDVERREARERDAFHTVATSGRSASAHASLVLPAQDFERLLGARSGTPDPLEQMVAWAQPLRGASVLEICCHDGEHGVVLARGGALVTSVDIVPELVELARRRIQENGVASRMTAKVMSVHALDLPSASFDVVFGKASLHHLDLELARAEILRVLRPGGVAIFAEPVRLSPRLAALRDIVPVAHDRDSPDERPLDGDDLARFTRGFSDVDVIYYRLLGRLGRIVPPAAKALAHVDRVLLDRVVALRSYAGVVVFRGRKPRR